MSNIATFLFEKFLGVSPCALIEKIAKDSVAKEIEALRTKTATADPSRQ